MKFTRKQNTSKSSKECEFPGCTNIFSGTVFQRYCNDERCKEIRRQLHSTAKKPKMENPNRIIDAKRYGPRLKHNQLLNIRCRAINGVGKRCSNVIHVLFDKRRKVYPNFCKEHTNSYRRNRYKLIKEEKFLWAS